MTCIIAINQKDKFIIGSDGQIGFNGLERDISREKWIHKQYNTIDENDNIIKTTSCYIGGAGDLLTINFIFDCFVLPDKPIDITIENYLQGFFTPQLHDDMRKCDLQTDLDGKYSERHIELIIIIENRVFSFKDKTIDEIIENYYSAGSGSHLATGSLHTTRKQKNGRSRIKRALEAAEYHSSSCGHGKFIYEIIKV